MMVNQATVVLAATALFRCTVNELPAASGTADWTQTPEWFCCKVAKIRLEPVSVTPVLVTDDFPALTVKTPAVLKNAGPLTVRAGPVPVFSAITPLPAPGALPIDAESAIPSRRCRTLARSVPSQRGERQSYNGVS